MKNSTYKNLLKIAKSKGSLAIFGGLILVSCGSQMGGYTETDGVYYDPNKDVIPEGIVLQEPLQNTVDEPYTYQNDSISIIEQNRQNQIAQQNKYKNWNNNQQPQSDWGNYAGTEQNYYYNDWGYPSYGWNSYMGFGWNSWNLGFSWGSPWYSYGYNPYYWDYYWGGYYPSYYGYYNPWYYGGYYPYYGGYYGYSPYYGGGYYNPRYYNYKRSGADSIVRGNGFNGNHRNVTRPNQGFQGNSGFRGNTPRANNNTPSVNQNSQNPNNSGIRSTPRPTTPRPTAPRQYETPRSNNWGNSNSNSGGFRSGGFNSGGSSSSSSSSGGGFRSSGGGTRSGGFR